MNLPEIHNKLTDEPTSFPPSRLADHDVYDVFPEYQGIATHVQRPDVTARHPRDPNGLERETRGIQISFELSTANVDLRSNVTNDTASHCDDPSLSNAEVYL